MIGFKSSETDAQSSRLKLAGPAADPGKKEAPPQKPDREIITPAPASIPSPRPDTIISSPAPEITPIPVENPVPGPSPEISPNQPAEFS